MSLIEQLRIFQIQSKESREGIQKIAYQNPFERTRLDIQKQLAE